MAEEKGLDLIKEINKFLINRLVDASTGDEVLTCQNIIEHMRKYKTLSADDGWYKIVHSKTGYQDEKILITNGYAVSSVEFFFGKSLDDLKNEFFNEKTDMKLVRL